MRLINADKIYPDVMTKFGALAISQGQLAYAPTVLTIPNNPTNGDVCRAIFDTMTCNYILSTMGINWWNSAYKRIVEND